ncbi:PREDICTED: protein jim lovell-like isoform X1 [Polistes canadensis]|uniref:protein jim lovell-like isoform X1 n=1 Tax=Polistes canadensis TaxID=91411 RepID=UPI000718FAD1|nr:PREDICTED: protein jim lovell-like isoform X1 [Polistes canadensis]XP_014608330.1 PREDICTED: protein jim lovell-like isoform X1 [Polistes canadensis]XP_014608339.1 PREDICTED: protein jim lovell-like isoform X1 [Polistes canadensis]XP_014608348.1 PREDICTED: protein jim lovell-like isoform X1 [Polistes canadensis]
MSREKQSSSDDRSMEINQDDLSGTMVASFECQNVNIDDSVPEIVLSNKGGPKLIHNDYMYTMHKKHPQHIRWRCVGRTTHCRGTLLTTKNCRKPQVSIEHNHKPNFAAAQLARKRYLELGKPHVLMMSSEEKGNVHQSFDEMEPVTILSKKDEIDKCRNYEDRQRWKKRIAKRKILQSNTPVSQSNATTTKTIRIATQSFMRPHIRNIAPAPSPQQQQQRQPKTLVLKTIPLKVKQVAPTTIKMPPRQTPQGVPQNIVHQQPTEVCLRWNSYHSNMQNSFPSLLDSEQFVDVTLACEGRSLKCHKMILSSCSDYLADLLRENPCQHPIILMKDLKFWEVEALVKFMYRGEVNVAHDKLPQLLNAAEALQVKGLAGPSPSSQNSKPPMLIPQTKTLISQPVVPHIVNETKENKPSTSGVPTLSSPKRAQKRQQSEPPEPRPFTKIRLQRPITPTSPPTTVKTEPLDIPLSPTEIFPESNEDNSNPVNFEKLISFHEEDDPGGDDLNDESREINFCEIPGPPDLNDCEDQMEFVPTDFLEQEQDIVEESEPGCNKDGKDDLTDHSSIDVGEGDDERDGEEEEEPCSKEGKTE